MPTFKNKTTMSEFTIINDKGKSYRQPPQQKRGVKRSRETNDTNVNNENNCNNHNNQEHVNCEVNWKEGAYNLTRELETKDDSDIVKQTWQAILSPQPKTTKIKMFGFAPWPGPIESGLELMVMAGKITLEVGQMFLDLLKSWKMQGVNLQTYDIPKKIDQCLYFDRKVPKIPLSESL